MAKDLVNIFNLALSIIGTRAKVSSPTESSKEAETCTLWYEISRDVVFRAAYWPSTRIHQRLALLKERTNLSEDWTVDDPSPDWTFAYSVPSDMIAPRFLTNFGRFVLEWWRPTTQPAIKAIMTDQKDAILQYSFRQDNMGQWDDSLYLAVAYALAMHIAMPLTGKLSREKRAREAGNLIIGDARADVANAEENRLDVVPDWIAARGYGEQAPRTKFYWPFGPALATSTQTPSISSVSSVADAQN